MSDFLIKLVNKYNSKVSTLSSQESQKIKKEILSIAKDMGEDISHLFEDIKNIAPKPKIVKIAPKKEATKTTTTPIKTPPAPKKEAVKSPTKRVKREGGEKVTERKIDIIPKYKYQNVKNLITKDNLTQQDVVILRDVQRMLTGDKDQRRFLDVHGFFHKIGDSSASGGYPKDKFLQTNINWKLEEYLKKQTAPAPKKEEKKVEKVEKVKSKSKILKGDNIEIETPAESVKGFYAIMELDDIIQSHDENTFSWNKKYPKQCQERDYQKSAEKDKVLTYSSKFNPKHLINDSPDALSGPPIVNRDGIVLGGNGRTMILKRVHRIGRFFMYENYLGDRLKTYGFDNPNKIKMDFKNPVLVRMIDTPMNRCLFYSRILNESLSREKSENTNSISMANALTQKGFLDIAEIFESGDEGTFNQVISDKKNQTKVINVLRRDGLITSSNSPKWLSEDGELTSGGKMLLENLLLGKILNEEKLIESAKEYTNRILRAIPVLTKIQTLPKKYDLIPVLRDVIKFESIRRSQGTTIKEFLNQENMFGSGDVPETKTAMLWLALASGINKFRAILESYYNTAKNDATGGDMFGLPPADPTEILQNLVNTKGLSDRIKVSEKAVDSGIIKKGNEVHGFYGKDCKYYYVAGSKFSNGAKSFIVTAMNDFSKYNTRHSNPRAKIYRFTDKKQAESKLNGLLLSSGYHKKQSKDVQMTLANRPKRQKKVLVYGISDKGSAKSFSSAKKVITNKKLSFADKLRQLIKY